MKKLLAPLMLPLALSLELCTYASAQEYDLAPNLTAQCRVTVSQNEKDQWALLDQNRATKFRVQDGLSLTLELEQPAGWVYLIWDTPPGEWSLSRAGAVTFTGGGNGFLHELVELETPGTLFEISAGRQGQELVLCDLYVFGVGELPAWVQQWRPPYDDADMLVLPTHADDEHLWFGGALPTYAGEQGRKVQVAYLTNHWAEPYRPHELLDGLWTAGVTAYPVIPEFADRYASSLEQAQSFYPQDEVLGYQVELLRRFKPEVVLGHDINGEYGHGAHIYNTWALMRALELAGDPAQYPESAQQYGVWEVPKTYLHLYSENAILLEWDQPLSSFGGKTGLEVAKEAFACHQSQADYFSVQNYGPYDCRKFGLYRSKVGLDQQKNDFFENLEPQHFSDYAAPAPQQATPQAQQSPLLQGEGSVSAPEGRANKNWEGSWAVGGFAVFLGSAVLGMGICAALLLFPKK